MKTINILETMRKHSAETQSAELALIIEVLTTYNVRISEILNCICENVYENRFVILKASKQSADIIIRDKELLKKFIKLKANRTGLLITNVNYQTVYNYIKNTYGHLFKNFKSSKNNKVTHAFRYLNILDITDDKSIKSILHHNSVKSQKYYKKTKKGE